MRKDCALANLEVISPSDLWTLPLIVSQQKYVSDSIEKWFKRNYEN
ncbi:hypothetical protein GAPWKB11_1621 [Gilliamella apicola]|nr:hypothetical protein GAPWKB11_1621 [Gilliamella apicola]